MEERVKIITSNIGGKILDVGCNSGKLHGYISKEHKDVFGIDNTVTNYNENMVKGECDYLPFKEGVFDSVVGGEIIEHLNQPKYFISECFRILKENGVIVLTTPNKKSLINRVFKSYQNPYHISLMDGPELIEILERTGFVTDSFICLPYTAESSEGTRFKKLFLFRKLIHPLLTQELQEEMLVLARKGAA